MNKDCKYYLLHYLNNTKRNDPNDLHNDCIILTYYSHYPNAVKRAIIFLEKNKKENIDLFCHALIINCPHFLRYIPKKYQTEEMAIYVYKRFLPFHANPLAATTDQLKDPVLGIWLKLRDSL